MLSGAAAATASGAAAAAVLLVQKQHVVAGLCRADGFAGTHRAQRMSLTSAVSLLDAPHRMNTEQCHEEISNQRYSLGVPAQR
jgi:hypothetical protein